MVGTKEPPSWIVLICPWCAERGMYQPDGDTVTCQAPQCGRPFKVAAAKRGKMEMGQPPEKSNGRIESIEKAFSKLDRQVDRHEIYWKIIIGLGSIIAAGAVAVLIERLLK